MSKLRTFLLALSLAWGGVAPAAQSASPPPEPVRDDYIIGAGDTLQIFVWQNPDLSTTVPVRPDGKISTPLVEDMVAVGKSPSQLGRDIEKVLTEFVRTPQVNVILVTALSASSQVQVVGEVKEPKAVPYRDGLMVLDVVLAAGGLTDFAAPNRAHIARKQGGKEVKLEVRIGDLMKGKMKQNLPLKPGDVLFIPVSRL